MRVMAAIFTVVLILAPRIASAQAIVDSRPSVATSDVNQHFTIRLAAGSTIQGGNTQAASFGYALSRHLTVLVGGDRMHMPTRVERFERGGAATRGGTSTLLTGALQIDVLPDRRLAPYVIVGVGTGVSRPNVNAIFPDLVTNRMGMVFSGAGLRVPVGRHLDLFGEARLALATERDVVMFSIPLRGGIAWRF